MKATNTYQEGYIGLTSGYLWSGIIYNISITISLYALAMFWVCMSQDLKPFRPMPKFLSIKGIIFASYWQGFFLSILVWLGALPDDVPGYTPDNLAAAIQDALICFEMPAFALAHWYAFSWHDYADPTISAARLPIRYALRDAFGYVDLVQDTKETLYGNQYGYRQFDARDSTLAHEESSSRTARMKAGMRYERGGKGKYWLPEPGHGSRKPLLGSSRARTMASPSRSRDTSTYGATDGDIEDPTLTAEDERLYEDARQLEFGDWNVSGRLGPPKSTITNILLPFSIQLSQRTLHSETMSCMRHLTLLQHLPIATYFSPAKSTERDASLEYKIFRVR